jgi:hypothetical protein
MAAFAWARRPLLVPAHFAYDCALLTARTLALLTACTLARDFRLLAWNAQFQPLLFERHQNTGQFESLYKEAFGPMPDLRNALGNAAGDSKFAKKLVENDPSILFKILDPDAEIVG